MVISSTGLQYRGCSCNVTEKDDGRLPWCCPKHGGGLFNARVCEEGREVSSVIDVSKLRPRLQAIHSIWDNEGQTVDDRFTVLLRNGTTEDRGAYLALSEDPDHLQGVSQYGAGASPGEHLGKEITLRELPLKVLHHLIRRLEG